MNTATRCTAFTSSRVEYAQMSLVELAERIVTQHDRHALKELHDNRVLCYQEGQDSLHLAEYVQVLSQGPVARRWCGDDDMALAKAYDLTVDKFSQLPAGPEGGAFHDSKGPDCRHYYRAFIGHVNDRLRANPPANTIQAEMLATRCLRALVARHFYLSCLESRRRAQRLVRRYIWKMDGHVLYVWLPIEMPGRRCRAWLQDNIPDVQPGCPGEQDRVQAIVDRLLSRPRCFSIDKACRPANDIAVAADPIAAMVEEEITGRGLADTIADEKAENINQQRPAIRLLGEERLRQLIQNIFEGLAAGDFQADRIASRFGLSEATFSRFAGSRWKKDTGGSDRVSVPDLFRNTAQTLALHPDFAAAAKRAGVWKRVTDVLNVPTTERREYE